MSVSPPTLTAEQIRAAQNHGSATLHEAAGRIGALPSFIKPLVFTARLCGPAFTVHGRGHDNLWIHRAVYAASAGDILVIATGQALEAGYWGEILNEAAMARHLGGLVIEGGVRDSVVLTAQPFPVFSAGLCIVGTGKDFGAKGWLNAAIRIGDTVIQPGDLICGDADGVVSIPKDRVDTVLKASVAREADEAAKIARIRAGERTVDLYKFGME
jgi:4-hydroxy-4-methyl-2-oxoglutarate aldolase